MPKHISNLHFSNTSPSKHQNNSAIICVIPSVSVASTSPMPLSISRLITPAPSVPQPSNKRRRPSFWEVVLDDGNLSQSSVPQRAELLDGPVLATTLTQSLDAGGLHRCDVCGAEFKRAGQMRDHAWTTHGQAKPFVCHLCPASFGHVSSKYRHVRTVHLKRRDFRCNRCGLSFGEKSGLSKHSRTVHEGARPYPCSICGYRFHFKLHLTQHVATVHEKLRPHRCPTCNTAFGQRSSLNRHRRQIHGTDTRTITKKLSSSSNYLSPTISSPSNAHPSSWTLRLILRKT